MYSYKRFGNDLDTVLKQIEDNKIVTMTTSLNITSFNDNKKIAKKSPYIFPAFGIHPLNAYKFVDKQDILKKFIEENNVIGEIGLDYLFEKNRNRHPLQRELFSFFLSQTKDKILSVHTYGAEKDSLTLLKHYGNSKVIIHWYSGNLSTLKKMIDEGYYFSIGAEVLFSDHIRKITETIPLEQILSETDNPGGFAYLTKKKGMPVLIKDVIGGIAEVKKKDSHEMEQIIQANFIRLTKDMVSLPYIQ
jgi:TatD DNase family protein